MGRKVLAVSFLFPNSRMPEFGVFVLHRLQALKRYCHVKVINPVPWFPGAGFFYRYGRLKGLPQYETIQGINVWHPRFMVIPRYAKFLDGFSFMAAVVPLVKKMSLSYDFDWIDLHWTYPDLGAGLKLARIFDKPLSVTIRGRAALNYFSSPGQNGSLVQERSLRTRLLNKWLPRADRVVAVSDELRDLAVDLGVKPQKVRVIPNGVDTSLFSLLSQKECREKLNLNHNARIVLAVGSLTYGKGFDRLISIWPHILKSYPDARLMIIGSPGPAGDYSLELKSAVTKYRLQESVSLVEHVPHTDLPLWYNAADLFCLSSRSEGSPNVLNEALACGCPAVAVDVGQVSQVLSDDEMGIVVDNDSQSLLNGILHALKITYTREKISEKVSNMTWDKCARSIVSMFDESR